MNALSEWALLKEMMFQGEFHRLTDLTHDPRYQAYFVEWWCLKTGNTYEYSGSTLEQGLLGVLKQAHEDKNPTTTEEELDSIKNRRKIGVCIPAMPKLLL